MAPRPGRKSKLKRTAGEETPKKDSKKSRTEESFSHKKCVLWFEQYSRFGDSNAEPNVIGPEGIEKFCKDLGVQPENVVMLVIAWKMDAKRMGFFTKEEWLKGFSELQCDGNTKLIAKIDSMTNILQDHTNFKSIYRFAYDFARDKDQRSMDTDTAKEMLYLLLGQQWKLYPQFHQFLEQSKYKVINKDQWYNILEFSRTISNDLSNYDVDGAWPVMLDEFVEWLKNSRADEPMMSN